MKINFSKYTIMCVLKLIIIVVRECNQLDIFQFYTSLNNDASFCRFDDICYVTENENKEENVDNIILFVYMLLQSARVEVR